MKLRSVGAASMVLLLVTSGVFVAGVDLAQAQEDGEEDEVTVEELQQQLEFQQQQINQMQEQSPPPARGEPDLNLRVPNPTVQTGETNEVNVQVTNDGDFESGVDEMRDAVTTARNVEIEADADDTPLEVRSGTMSVGTVSDAQPNEAPIAIDVPEDVDAGTYSIDVDVSYMYTERSTSSSNVYEESETETMSIDVVVDDDAQFDIVETRTDAQIGDSGTLEADVENTGNETATDINVALETMSGGFMFGSAEHETATEADSAWIDELEPNETATVSYDVSVMPDTSERQYMLDGTVAFKTADGYDRVDESPAVGVIPQAEQQFTIDTIESTLYVGEDGNIRGVVTNDGPADAENVVVQFTEESQTIVPIERSVAVGTLGAGESESFELPLDVSGQAEPIDRAIDLGVQYRNADFEQRMYQDLEVVTPVHEQRDQFEVEVLDREIGAGDEKHVDVEVTNNLDETVTDVEASLFADDPLDSDDDEAFVETLEAGESVTMTFDLEADDEATAKTYPISFDFRYDDESGNSQLSDTTRVAIDVGEGSGGLPVGIIAVVTLIGVGAGAYVYQRS
ncbi:exo-alpha-sialidase [Halostagnicola sp. A-GB9-2]|uniref:COG1361 S-layer family protein n=1 Tax=Halostagnicola sp. A-GB9-2 TaxID=3048066 RepID=UPI0024BF488B|nr:exo-alpha-sialidase [Halostagnicola sp. A-GB9-2]MDJ1434829.1 exo-alpha-sialidase [Halostagnicola sp. A-GB9-2]